MKNLPADYQPAWRLEFPRARGLILGLNLISLPMLLFFGWLFYQIIARIRPGENIFVFLSMKGAWLAFALIGTYAFTVTLHEICHGLVFWAFTGVPPKYGFRVVYAFAAAPGFFLPRNPYVLVGLAPLALISLLGLTLAFTTPSTWVGLVWFALTTNAAGAVGDLYIIGRLLLAHPVDVLIEDEGDCFTVYHPAL